MSFLKKVGNELKILWASLFFGMKSADIVIHSQSSDKDDESITKKMGGGGVFADMLEEKMTREVKETRDKYYRVLREADKYTAKDMSVEEVTVTGENGQKETVLVFHGGVKKKRKEDFMKHPPVFEKEGFLLRVIQDNKHFEKKSSIKYQGYADEIYIPNGIYDYDTTLTIERDFIPRFELEKFVKRMVVRCKEASDRAEVDLYLPTEASQFGKIDAILISNLFTMFQEKTKKSDIVDIKGMEWYTDHAWNCDDVCLFKFDDVKYQEINIFDGNFVLTFDCHILDLGTDLAAQYRTEELDEKYATQAPKHDGIDVFTIMRHEEKKEKNKGGIDLDNISDTTIKLS